MNVRRFAGREALNAALARQLKQAIEDEPVPSPGSRGRARVGASSPRAIMLSGGHAPRPAYQSLGATDLQPATSLRVFYSDERYVPATAEASNYRTSLPLLRALGLPDEHVLRVRTEWPLDEAAADYERRLGELSDSGARLPLGLLGLGADGHTASLFSFADLERARGRLAIAVQRPDGLHAVTVTPQLLSLIEHVLVVVVGGQKRQALEAFLAKDPESIAWRAVERCRSIEVWYESGS